MPLTLMILTNHFAIEPRHIREGISYRFVGLYGSLVKALLKKAPDSEIFWYSHGDQCLRLISQKGVVKKSSSQLGAVVRVLRQTSKSNSRLSVIVAFPAAAPAIRGLIWYIASLIILKIFTTGGRVRVFVDDFDPPVEGIHAMSESSPSMQTIVYRRMLEMLTLYFASVTLVVSNSFKHYFMSLYKIRMDKILVVPNGSLLALIPRISPRIKTPLKVLYSGAAVKIKNIDTLCSVITELRESGLQIELNIAGSTRMELPWWVHTGSYNWPDFVSNILSSSDVGVIPYTPDRMSMFLPTKTFDYMAAAMPIISTNLPEIAKIIKTFDCGLVARNWEEFRLGLRSLYEDRQEARRLGENGRAAAEKYFDYELLAEKLLLELFLEASAPAINQDPALTGPVRS